MVAVTQKPDSIIGSRVSFLGNKPYEHMSVVVPAGDLITKSRILTASESISEIRASLKDPDRESKIIDSIRGMSKVSHEHAVPAAAPEAAQTATLQQTAASAVQPGQ